MKTQLATVNPWRFANPRLRAAALKIRDVLYFRLLGSFKFELCLGDDRTWAAQEFFEWRIGAWWTPQGINFLAVSFESN